MNKLFILISSALLLIGCSNKTVKTILLSNPTDDVREEAMVEVCAKALGLTADADFAALGLFDETGKQIPYQVMHYGQPEVQIRGGLFASQNHSSADCHSRKCALRTGA